LVTGGLGFIGSNFILQLLSKNLDYKIINLDAELYGSNHKNLEDVTNSGNYRYVKGDITNSSLLEELVSDSDIVVNFAAESFVDRSISNAEPFFKSNVEGVFKLLEIVRSKKKTIVQISTDEVFGSMKMNSANEDTRFNPSSPYSATKAAAELLVNSYHITYDCNTIITRCTNNYGPRQFPEKLIPKVIMRAMNNMKIPIYGNGKNIRDWLFVDDHCAAILKVIEKGKSGESYNVSANNEIDNLTIVRKTLELMDKPEDLIEYVEDRPGHDFRYSMNSTKIRSHLGWSEKISFESGLEKTIQWYLSHQDHWKDASRITENSTPWKE